MTWKYQIAYLWRWTWFEHGDGDGDGDMIRIQYGCNQIWDRIGWHRIIRLISASIQCLSIQAIRLPRIAYLCTSVPTDPHTIRRKKTPLPSILILQLDCHYSDSMPLSERVQVHLVLFWLNRWDDGHMLCVVDTNIVAVSMDCCSDMWCGISACARSTYSINHDLNASPPENMQYAGSCVTRIYRLTS